MAETTQSSPAQTETPQTQTTAPAPDPMQAIVQKNNISIEEQAAEFKPQQQQPQQPVQPKVPDPFSPDFQAYQAQLASGLSTLSQALAQTKGELSQMQQKVAYERTEAEIKSAVSIVSEGSKLDPTIVEVALEAEARRSPQFKAIWNNRNKNPGALTEALKVLTTRFQEQFSVKQDPQLIENQRAMQASRQQMATTQKTSEQDEWASMKPAERQAKVQRMIRGG
jgi:hypothetical protein